MLPKRSIMTKAQELRTITDTVFIAPHKAQYDKLLKCCKTEALKGNSQYSFTTDSLPERIIFKLQLEGFKCDILYSSRGEPNKLHVTISW